MGWTGIKDNYKMQQFAFRELSPDVFSFSPSVLRNRKTFLEISLPNLAHEELASYAIW
jgi:hypothetical protein